MNLEQKYQKLNEIEKRIRENYLLLIEEEQNPANFDNDFLLSELSKNIEDETNFLFTIFKNNDVSKIKKTILKLNMAPIYKMRLLNYLNNYESDDCFIYLDTLKYDVNKIITIFINNILKDNNFFEVRSYLIKYKYQTYYLNQRTEYDFINNNQITKIESINYRTKEFNSYIFVDKSYLVLNTYQALDFINENSYNIQDREVYAEIILMIMEIIAYLIISDETCLKIINPLVNNFFNDPNLESEIKNIYNYLLSILNNYYQKFKRTRYK